ncbi:hypothetical protein PLICRDRAFT_119857, partial [Plicaturopsis crispa FD-325 SS-3]
EASLRQRYPAAQIKPGIIGTPMTVVDMHGVILLWYLPGALCKNRQETIIEHTARLEPLLRESVSKHVGGNWRTDPALYSAADKCVKVPRGCINVSPAWFQQGHDTPDDHLETSSSLRGRDAKFTHPWLEDMAESLALINAVMGIIHPELYLCGRETLLKLGRSTEGESLAYVLRKWGSVFNGAAIIGNRETPIHRDNNSRGQWYDLLATVGTYDDAVMEIPVVGIRLDYSGGTMVGLAGRILSHGVSRSVGERLCLAFYMRDKVHQRMGTRCAGWMDYGRYGWPGE